MENEVLTMSNLWTTENKGIFSGNMLKIFALVCMTIDHIGLYLMDNSYPMRAIGRLAFPIFAYMIAEGCKYTHNRTRYFYTIFIINQAENFSRLFPLLFARKFNYLYFFLKNLVKPIVKCPI